MQAMIYLKEHPEIKHGDIRIAFNPDEEIGLGAHLFDVKRFGCDWAYTMDGGEVGEVNTKISMPPRQNCKSRELAYTRAMPRTKW